MLDTGSSILEPLHVESTPASNSDKPKKKPPVNLTLHLKGLNSGEIPKPEFNPKPAKLKINHKSTVPLSTQLEFFPLHEETQRVTANALSRSSLFTINARPAKDQPREIIVNRTQIFTLKGCSIFFSGEVLDQYDYDVFMAVIKLYGNNHKYSETITTHPLELLELAGWHNSKKEYLRLDETLKRLVRANIEVEYVRHEYPKDKHGKKTSNEPIERSVKVVGHLLSTYKRSEINKGGCGHKRLIDIKPDEEIILMFEPGTYSSIDWEKHCKLSPLAKFLNNFYATHAKPFAYSVDIIMKLSGSRSKSHASFKQALVKALQELVTQGIMEAYSIKDNNVHVMKKA